MSREPEQYLDLAYHRVWEWREDDVEPYWVVRLAEIPEVVDDGTTRPEAADALRACLVDYMHCRLAEELPIPEPSPEAATG